MTANRPSAPLPHSSGGQIQPCLLCRCAAVQVAASVASEDLRKAWQALGVDFGSAAWAVLQGTPNVLLYQCRACGFRFCDPSLAGDGTFYAELERQRASYYPSEVPEFTRTLAWARQLGLGRVLDIGCGDGAFLDRAREQGLKTAGLELNQQAAAAARAKGHDVQTRSLAEVSAEPGRPRCDLVTLFQVVEHVPDPVAFVRQARALLRPGGYLSVAVPNERGVYRLCPFEPHEWPPHHITRWLRPDLEKLGKLCDLRLIHSGANRLSGFEIRHFWDLHNTIAKSLGMAPHPGGTLLPAVLSFTYRKLGLKFLVPGMGTSVYAFYQQP